MEGVKFTQSFAKGLSEMKWVAAYAALVLNTLQPGNGDAKVGAKYTLESRLTRKAGLLWLEPLPV
jgi:hypothetical protein